ncbi:16S rRNA (cytosine(967)-C(5))-methyltransferase RsmB [Vibrio ulleungensis]|uniref:16S rRNA (cytosine(967)-C(5))-methyltransferase n=1 Tax=Vibrio ulleungensis TaxID=2807619 RepID=A0ABS2HM44_9VIBR|nr:16S rRNA (cytosine(967)-C(5))-methyltransferase RsmB [Vibrio ulleungensis]MBM7038553.1 16S rRNA (cytosine(967)-C(5))-methyltransferase RsmB [Vibrio ulleungensis]
MNVRAVAADVLFRVVDKGQSMSTLLPQALGKIKPRDHALLQEICYGSLRVLPRLEAIASELMDKPLKGKQRVFHHLILVGLYQLSAMRVAEHAAVAETVEATKDLKGPRLRGLINAVLRNYQRNKEALDAKAISFDAGKYVHPSWLLKLLKEAYPDQWQSIIEANNTKAPMWIRVNTQHNSVDAYLALLEQEGIAATKNAFAPHALLLEKPQDVRNLPGFEQGWASVQDAAAQLSAGFLKPHDDELILDCCAAPGGKTAHILELAPNAQVVAVDSDEQRLERVHDNFERLNISAQIICGDARYPQDWWQGEQFDKILLDAPCSATGVIRRHPDIKWLRRANDIEALADLQREIMDAMWQQLKVGGTMVYATCSITPQENVDQVKAFLSRTSNVQLELSDIEAPGLQILPGQDNMDGFYYAVLTKQA